MIYKIERLRELEWKCSAMQLFSKQKFADIFEQSTFNETISRLQFSSQKEKKSSNIGGYCKLTVCVCFADLDEILLEVKKWSYGTERLVWLLTTCTI